MDNITYEIWTSRDRFVVVMHDPLWPVPWYMKSFRKGQYDWSRSFLWAREMSESTAIRHKAALESGVDKEWKEYHDHWDKYWKSIGINK